MRSKLGAAAVVVAAVASAGEARSGETERAGFDLGLTARDPGAPTGLDLHVRFKHPGDPRAKPPALVAGAFTLPRDLVVDTTAVPACEADDAAIRARGRAACPAESKVGEGTLVADTGVPGADRVQADIVAFNGPQQVIEVVFFQGTNVVAGIDRLTLEDGKLVAHPPATPGGPPDGRTTIREIRLTIPPRGDYVTAPPDCPRRGWRARADLEFADGGKASVPSASGCRPPRLGLAVTAVARRTYRVRVSSTARRCISGARLRAGRRRARTDGRGRATLRVPAGARRIVARHPRCRTTSARISIN